MDTYSCLCYLFSWHYAFMPSIFVTSFLLPNVVHPGVAAWVCILCSHMDPTLGLMICCHYLGIPNDFLTVRLSFCPGPTNYAALNMEGSIESPGGTLKNTGSQASPGKK